MISSLISVVSFVVGFLFYNKTTNPSIFYSVVSGIMTYLFLSFLHLFSLLMYGKFKTNFIKDIKCDDNNFSLYLTLIKIREAELATIYRLIKEYKLKAEEKNTDWIRVYFEELAEYGGQDHEIYLDQSKQKKLKKTRLSKLLKVYEERFKSVYYLPYDFIDDELKDLYISLMGGSGIIKRLEEMKPGMANYSFLEKLVYYYYDISYLDYKTIFYKSNNYLFKLIMYRKRMSLIMVNHIWEKVIDSLKAYLYLKKGSNEIEGKDVTHLLEKLNEIEALKNFTELFEFTMASKKDKGVGFKDEKFLRYMKNNEFYYTLDHLLEP